MRNLDQNIADTISQIVTQVSEAGTLIETGLNWLKFDLEQAFQDTKTIDEQCCLNATERLLVFLAKDGASEKVVKYTLVSRDLKTFKKVHENLFIDTGAYDREFHLWRIREQLRDQIPLNHLLPGYASVLADRAKEGDQDFFKRFGLIVKDAVDRPEKFNRSIEGWIVRGWLCLALWEVENANEAYDRCLPVGQYLEIQMPSYEQFEAAFKKAKGRKRPQA